MTASHRIRSASVLFFGLHSERVEEFLQNKTDKIDFLLNYDFQQQLSSDTMIMLTSGESEVFVTVLPPPVSAETPSKIKAQQQSISPRADSLLCGPSCWDPTEITLGFSTTKWQRRPTVFFFFQNNPFFSSSFFP